MVGSVLGPGSRSCVVLSVGGVLKVFDFGNGTYQCDWLPRAGGEHLVAVLLRGQHIRGSPFLVAGALDQSAAELVVRKVRT